MIFWGQRPMEQLGLFRCTDQYGPMIYFTRYEEGEDSTCLWWHIPGWVQ